MLIKIKGFNIKPPKHESGLYETHELMPKMHQVCIAVGKRASGKSTAIVNLIENLEYDYCIAVSPTMNSNLELMKRLNILHIFEDVDDPSIIDNIKKIVEDEATVLEQYKQDLKDYYKMVNDIDKGNFLHDNDLMKFYHDNDFMKPTHIWHGKKPRIAVIFDDMMGSTIYSKPRKLNALSTYSRHIGQLKEGGAIGVSLFFLIQSFKAQSGGLSKVIRNQCTSLLLFKTKDLKELDDVANSCGGEIDVELFKTVYDTAIGSGEGYPFLFIDLHKKPSHVSMFRRYFNEFIISEELK